MSNSFNAGMEDFGDDAVKLVVIGDMHEAENVKIALTKSKIDYFIKYSEVRRNESLGTSPPTEFYVKKPDFYNALNVIRNIKGISIIEVAPADQGPKLQTKNTMALVVIVFIAISLLACGISFLLMNTK